MACIKASVAATTAQRTAPKGTTKNHINPPLPPPKKGEVRRPELPRSVSPHSQSMPVDTRGTRQPSTVHSAEIAAFGIAGMMSESDAANFETSRATWGKATKNHRIHRLETILSIKGAKAQAPKRAQLDCRTEHDGKRQANAGCHRHRTATVP